MVSLRLEEDNHRNPCRQLTRVAARCALTLMTLLGTTQSVSQTIAEPKSAPMFILMAQLATTSVSHKDASVCMHRQHR